MPSPSPSPPLPRRRACTNCTSAKAKCTPRTPNLCERCHRLGKQCFYGVIASATTRRLPPAPSGVGGVGKNGKKGKENIAAGKRVQRLEAKVDGLAAKLDQIVKGGGGGGQRQQQQDRQGGGDGDGVPGMPAIGSNATSSSQRSRDAASSSWDSSRCEVEVESLDATSMDFSETGSVEEYPYSLQDSCQEDEENLAIFRQHYCHEFPFILLAADETTKSLRRSRPFLFLAIVAVTSYRNPQLQRRLGREMQKQIASRIVMKNERSLDLLQGLLVYLAWYQCLLQDRSSSQILLLLQLCVTLVSEMGLMRDYSTRVAAKYGPGDEEASAGTGSSSSKVSLDELRAFLGTFYLCSSYSTTFGNLEIMCYSDHVHRCFKRLREASHLESDQWAARLVEFEILVRRVSSTFKYSSPGDSRIRGEDSICAIVDGFERELESLQADAQRDAQGRGLKLSQTVTFVNAWIHEVAFHHLLWEMPPSEAASAGSQPLANAQINMLWQNLATSKRYLVDFMSVEDGRLYHLPYIEWVRLCYMIAVCCKVVFCSVEQQCALPIYAGCGALIGWTVPHQQKLSWDFLSAAKTADFQRIGGLIGDKIRTVEEEMRKDDETKDAVAQFAHCMSGIVNSYERQLQAMSTENKENGASAQVAVARLAAASWNVPAPESSTPQLNEQGTNDTSDLGWDMPMDFQTDNLDNIVWESLMNDFTALPQQPR